MVSVTCPKIKNLYIVILQLKRTRLIPKINNLNQLLFLLLLIPVANFLYNFDVSRVLSLGQQALVKELLLRTNIHKNHCPHFLLHNFTFKNINEQYQRISMIITPLQKVTEITSTM